MILGLIIIGMLTGTLVAGAALIAGHSVWIALALYSAVGTASIVLIALSILLTSWASSSKMETVVRALSESG